MTNLNEKIHAIISEITDKTDFPKGESFLAGNLTTDFGLDSLDVINILFQIEEEMGVHIPEEDINKFDLFVVSKLLEYVEKNLQQ